MDCHERLGLTLVDLGHEAKVARTSLDTTEQVRVLLLVGIDDGSVGKDDLEVRDGIASETAGLRVERVLR